MSAVPECMVCREHNGEIEIPGGHLIANDLVVAFHHPPLPHAPTPYLGHLFVTSRQHVASFAELSEEEAAAVGVAISSLSRALKKEGAEPVYTATIGHGWAHLHVHVIPRWPETPSDVSWRDVDEWEGARRGDAGAVAAMTERLRAHLSSDAN